MEYGQSAVNDRVQYNGEKVHSWKPPCSCGVELEEIQDERGVIKGEKVHSWKPPCSCGVSIDDVLE